MDEGGQHGGELPGRARLAGLAHDRDEPLEAELVRALAVEELAQRLGKARVADRQERVQGRDLRVGEQARVLDEPDRGLEELERAILAYHSVELAHREALARLGEGRFGVTLGAARIRLAAVPGDPCAVRESVRVAQAKRADLIIEAQLRHGQARVGRAAVRLPVAELALEVGNDGSRLVGRRVDLLEHRVEALLEDTQDAVLEQVSAAWAALPGEDGEAPLLRLGVGVERHREGRAGERR